MTEPNSTVGSRFTISLAVQVQVGSTMARLKKFPHGRLTAKTGTIRGFLFDREKIEAPKPGASARG